jgi:hypothetical protein
MGTSPTRTFVRFETRHGWVAIVCGTDERWVKLTKAMDCPERAADASLCNLQGRNARIQRGDG